jgi:gentisate 1,2-dioxygenase
VALGQSAQAGNEAGRIVPVGRGGERRAIALANPALGGRPFATPTLWAAIQYLMPGEDAPEHRHTQHAFRFVVEGEGVWTVVNGDSIRMSRGDLPQGGWNWHAHHNAASQPMAWIDGLDIPFAYYTESQFFEHGRLHLDPHERARPSSRAPSASGPSRPAPCGASAGQPEHAFAGLPLGGHRPRAAEQLALEAEGHAATSAPAMPPCATPTPPMAATCCPPFAAKCTAWLAAPAPAKREVGSAVFQVFDGQGTVTVGERQWQVRRGDMFVVPSWQLFSAQCDADQPQLDLFRFADTPIFEAVHAYRSETP